MNIKNIERKRNITDRRQKNSKNYKDNKREKIRRSEDRKNLITYYITLYGAFIFIMALGIASYFYQLGE